MTNNRLFFSHSLATYGTEVESACLGWLHEHYPGCHIINPKYIQITEDIATPADFNRMMADYILPIVRSCHTVTFYKDGSYSPGVDAEVEEAKRQGLAVVEIRL